MSAAARATGGHRVGVLLTCLAVPLALTACSGSGSVAESGGTHVLIGAEGDGDIVAGVGFGGRVTIVGDCLGIEQFTVIWPHGTEIVSDSPLVIDVPGFGRVSPGDAIQGGGEDWGHHLPKGIDAVPPGCPDQGLMAFWPDHP